jgi:hypothetical protein
VLPPVADLSAIRAGTLLICVTGDRDNLARNVDARRIYRESTGIPEADKAYVVMQSDNHGSPALVANHFAPAAPALLMTSFQGDTGNQPVGPVRAFLQEQIRERRAEEGGGPTGSTAKAGVTPLAYFGIWKLFDALTNAAFYGKDRVYAFGGGPEQCGMGYWSDGVPVKPLLVSRP